MDALAQGISPQDVTRLVKQALEKNLYDCLWFGDVQVYPLPNQGPYGGMQFSVAFQIAPRPPTITQIKKLSRVHIDVGFGDSILFPQQRSIMASLIPKLEPVSWLIYPLESIFAEKLEALLRRGSANSRAKDVHDLVILFEKCLNMPRLKEAILLTFSNRSMELPVSFAADINALDMSMLERAWNSVLIVGVKKSFNEMRHDLIGCLTKLDSVFEP